MKLIKFEKDDCVPCKNVSLYLDSKNIKYERINPFDNPDMAVKYRVRSVPTVILVDDNGNEIIREIGENLDNLDKIIKMM